MANALWSADATAQRATGHYRRRDESRLKFDFLEPKPGQRLTREDLQLQRLGQAYRKSNSLFETTRPGERAIADLRTTTAHARTYEKQALRETAWDKRSHSFLAQRRRLIRSST